MKNFMLIILLTGIVLSPAWSQNVPNGDLEDWEINGLGGTEPVGWVTLNDDSFTNVFQVPGHSGQHAAKLSVEWDPIGEMFVGAMFFADGNFGISERFTAFEFYIQGNTAGDDYLSVSVGMWKQNNLLGFGNHDYVINNAGWTKIVLPIEYTSSDIPEECFIGMQVGGIEGVTSGTFYIIDELTLTMNTGPSGITDQSMITVGDMQIYPNPFPGKGSLVIHAPEETGGKIEIIDLQGQILKTVFSGNLMRGENRFDIFLPEQDNGLYICRLSYTGGRVAKTIILNK
ncbi:MAG: T9SS type A sorting domain-containing protein [Bacteroidales bacterium]|nr:T9SS type A sorting domain-containing protein [Bacteroidales bacterium]